MSLIDKILYRPTQAPVGEEELDRLARPVYVGLEEWVVRCTMTVTGGGPSDMIQQLRTHIDSFARQAPQFSDQAMDDIRTLDSRLSLRGRLFEVCREASRDLSMFRSTLNGSDWQRAMKTAHDAANALEAARKRCLGSGFGGVSVTVSR